MTENWKGIPGFADYQVSDMGNVKSIKRHLHYRMLKPHTDRASGRREVNLRKSGKTYHSKIAWLVAITFIGEKKDGQEVRHKNDIQSDDRLTNLEYGTHLENMHDAIRNGKLRSIPADVVRAIRRSIEAGESKTQAANSNGVSLSAVSRIVNGSRHKHDREFVAP